MNSEIIIFEKKTKVLIIFALFLFLVHLLPILIKKNPSIPLCGVGGRLKSTYFEGKNMALRLRQRFLASFN